MSARREVQCAARGQTANAAGEVGRRVKRRLVLKRHAHVLAAHAVGEDTLDEPLLLRPVALGDRGTRRLARKSLNVADARTLNVGHGHVEGGAQQVQGHAGRHD